MNGRYVVAFAGARDAYQVPLALQEAGMLESLVTDFYCPPVVASAVQGTRWEKAARRSVHGLPFHKTTSLWTLALREQLGYRFFYKDWTALDKAQRGQAALSAGVVSVAERTGANLLLYAGYAETAFSSPALESARRVLFMYHPHVRPAAAILERDVARFNIPGAVLKDLANDLKDDSIDRELGRADRIICASTFTAQTIVEVGVDVRRIVIIPYGIDVGPSVQAVAPRKNRACQFLFVGSGVHRKGVHILLAAWKRAALPNAELHLVCRNIEPWLAEATKQSGVTVIPGLSPQQLEERYRSTDVFVLPSLVEGFGYVYLEALARGCYCIGTPNTGLPDLSLPEEVASVVSAGDVDALVVGLREAHQRWRHDELRPEVIAQAVAAWDWSRFRRHIVSAVKAPTT
jgi:glycosyltransferase involved in cell wall biosynthesis